MDIFSLESQDPKISITDCPLKHEVDIFSFFQKLSGEMLYNEDSEFFSSQEETCNKIQHNTLSSYNFHDLAEAGIPMLSVIKSYSCT